MSRLSIKRVLVGTIAAIMFALQLPLPALAATDGTVLAAAQSGINYLAANQNVDGSISGGIGGESDWSVEAIQAGGQQASTFSHGGSASLLDFLKTDVPSAATSTTAIERKIIALAAAGQDATNFGGVNYDALLESQHTGGQIGDPTLLNDDAFGVIAIDAAHAIQLQSEAQDGLNYLLAHQGVDGGFSSTTASCAFCGSDSSDTATAIIAMQVATSMGLSNPGLAAAESNAQAYLLSTQQPDGGFANDVFSPSDGDSTAWSLMALNSIGGSTVQVQALAARDWLLANQNPDSGFSYGAFGITTSDTYTTAHAVIALLGTTWLLQPVPLQGVATSPAATGGSGGGSTAAASAPANTSPAPPASTTTTSSDTSSAGGDPQVLGAQTGAQETDKPLAAAKTKPKDNAVLDKANTSYSLYAVLALGFIAFIWYMLQSRRKPEGV